MNSLRFISFDSEIGAFICFHNFHTEAETVGAAARPTSSDRTLGILHIFAFAFKVRRGSLRLVCQRRHSEYTEF